MRAASRPIHPSLVSHDVLAYSLFSMGDQWEFTGSEEESDSVVSVKVTPRMRTNSGGHLSRGRSASPGHRAAAPFLVGPDLLAGSWWR